MANLKNQATYIGHAHGYDYAEYCDAYGGDVHAKPEVPLYLREVEADYLAAFAAGIQRYELNQAVEAAEDARGHVGG